WVLTIVIGSSLPTYVPAMLCSLSVDAETICSPSDERIECTTYRPGYIKAASNSGLSSHNFRPATFPVITSIILNLTPSAKLSFIKRPVLLLASTNILQRGKLKAPGSVLSAAKTQNTSLGLSSISSSATPGPIPLTFPERHLSANPVQRHTNLVPLQFWYLL